MSLLKLLAGKDVLVGVIDVANDRVETPEEVAATIAEAMKYVAKEKVFPCTNCGMAPMRREIAMAKLASLGRGAVLARQKFGKAAKASPKRSPKKSKLAKKPAKKKPRR
jgi:5-methyltetrahydropteroyltriglutamate--homocysteine methyltransferase